jgi:uncharacterized protein (TIGR03083 family)
MSLDYTVHLRSDGEKMALAVAADLDAHVPTCPAWNVAKLTIHTGQHHRWVADAIRKRGEVPDEPGKPGLRDDALVEWFRDGWRDLADLLDTVADEDPAWTWSGDNRAGFWRRRTALETLVHRWDAENATGRPTPLDPGLSADGIDEMLFVMMGDGVYTGPRFRMGVSASGLTRVWSVDVEDGQTPRAAVSDGPVAPGHGVVTVAGAAEDVLLFLWGRRGQEAVTLDGDDAARAALLAWLSE